MKCQSVGKWIRSWRKSREMSASELGHMLKVTSQYISNIENGAHTAPVRFVFRLMPLLKPKDKLDLSLVLEEEILTKKVRGIIKAHR